MQVNNVKSNQNFGMAMIIRKDAQKLLAQKIKSDADIQLLDSLVETQKKNPFEIDVREELGKLYAYIGDATEGVTNHQLTVLKQGFFEKHFKSPLAFIERCCKVADKKNERTYVPNMNSKLKDIFEKTKVAE